jgi:predicted PurR-regulated permease PerM
MKDEPISHRIFIERLVIAIIVVGIALLLWNLRGLFMLIFGAALVSVILRLVARPIRERLKVPDWAALLAAVLIVLAVIIAAFWTLGTQVTRQAEALRDLIPAAWTALEARLNAWGLGEAARQWIDSLGEGGGIGANFGAFAVTVGNGIADTLLVVVGGIYLAAQPELYRIGMLKLVPERGRWPRRRSRRAGGRSISGCSGESSR